METLVVINYSVAMTEDEMSKERAISELSEEVQGAQEALMVAIEQDRDKWWDARQLTNATRNGVDWPGEIMTFALTDLVNQGRLELGSDLQVKFKTF
jgi:hypothetical protein